MLTRFELKKLYGDRVLTVFFALAVFAALLFACRHTEPTAYDKEETARILASFETFPAQTYRIWTEKQQVYRDYLADETASSLPPFLSDYDAYRRAWEMFSRQTRYHDRLDAVLRQTQGEDAVSVFQSALYQKNQALRLSHDDMQFLPGLFDALAFASCLALVCSALFGISLAYADRRHGVEQLLFASPRGRARTRASKLSAVFLACALGSACLFFASLLPFVLQNGAVPWKAYLQNHESFFVCPYPLAVWQAVLTLFLLTCLGSFALGVCACLIGKHTRRQAVALLLTAVLLFALGTSTLFATPDGRSLLHLVSPFAFCDGRVAFGHLYAVRIGSHAAGGLPVSVCAWTFLCALLCVFFVFRHVPAAAIPKVKLRIPSPRVPRFVHTVGVFEAYKQLVCNKALLLFLPLLLLFAWQFPPMLTPDESYTEQTYRMYMQQLQGAYTPEKQRLVDDSLAEVQSVLAQKQDMDAWFADGRITESEMTDFMRRFGNAQAKEKALVRVAEQLAFVRSQSGAEIVYDSGWNVLFSLRLHLFPAGLICAVCCGLFADEYKRGMQRLFPRQSRRQVARAKYAFAVLFACTAALGFEAVQLTLLASRFALPLPFAPSASILQVQSFGTLPLLCAACVSVLQRVLGCVLTALVCTLCSRLLRRKHAAFVCGMLSALPWVMG
ncbi:MAG: hypothetical protein IJD82_07965 [Clostridia bacterium]|nr:hypothetical protein [Clostridia bacterium]